MSRVPIRLRLMAAFSTAMLAVLAAAALIVYMSARASLDESVTASAWARADALADGLGTSPGLPQPGAEPLEPEEAFAQLVSPQGRVLRRTGGAASPALEPSLLERAAQEPVLVDVQVEGIEGTARVVARPASSRPGSPVVIAGQSLEDRDETLAGLLATFAVGGPVAAALASLLGYLLAAAGLAPVEAMRRRATEISLEAGGVLPLPAANDEVRRLGETLNEMLARLRGSVEREQRFVADASHELRTPVAVLKTDIEAALAAGSHPPEVAESLRSALEECDHLAQLAEDLLVVARTADGPLPVRTERVRALTVVEDVRSRFSVRAAQQQRRIRIAAPDGLELEIDPLRIRQALGNLVDNALRHGTGTISIAVGADQREVELAVCDEGSGLPSELGASAFERLTRGDAARSRGGAGLGLAIVRTIARAHGGEAEVSTGNRARVVIRLPRSGARAAASPERPESFAPL